MRVRFRALLAGILVVSLLLLQHETALHAFAHAPGLASDELRMEQDGLHHEDVCDVCLAHAALSALTTPGGERVLPVGGDVRSPASPPAFLPATVRAYSARAPPIPSA